MKAALNLKQNQRLAMTPQLQQAIGFLQMNLAELSAALVDAHMANPLLDMEEPENWNESIPDDPLSVMDFMDESRISFNEDWVSLRTRTLSSHSTQVNAFSEVPTQLRQDGSLHELLRDQLNLLGLNPLQKLLTDYIVLHLNGAGYLDVGLETMIVDLQGDFESECKITRSDMESALAKVQSLDPVGVGARTVAECLMLQLSSQGLGGNGLETAKCLVGSYLPLLAKKDFPALRRKLGVDQDILCEAIELIQQLNPYPGSSIGGESVDYITPDIVVERHGRVWTAKLNLAVFPKVLINPKYQLLVKENDGDESYSQLKTQLQDARWLLANIKKRHETILSVASAIVVQQQSFFDDGPAMMKPMAMRAIAEMLDIHESTVSRAVNGKYMSTPKGTFELKYFFSAEVGTVNGNQASSVAVRALIRGLIASESPSKPISDMEICEELHSMGIDIARRTIAKYREQMHILPSNRRKLLLRASKN